MSTSDAAGPPLAAGEQQLIQRLADGDGSAIAEIEARFGPELRLFCRRMLHDAQSAEDVVQDVLLACHRIGPEARPQRSLRGWLYQAARRRCIDVLRKGSTTDVPAARAARRPQTSLDLAVDPLTTPSGKALKRDRAVKILSLLGELDEELRSVIVMQYFQELSREEIAEAIGLSLAGTKARIARAMQVLRDKLETFHDRKP